MSTLAHPLPAIEGHVVLVVNAGSSSIKCSVYRVVDDPQAEGGARAILGAGGQIEAIGVTPRVVAHMADGRLIVDETFPVAQVSDHDAAFRLLRLVLAVGLRDTPPAAIGHRVVHGGAHHADAVLIDDAVIEELDALTPLAPLHQPHNLEAIRAVRAAAPDLVQVACFDTAFHARAGVLAKLFALPYSYYENGIHRYGFHGLSYEYIARRLHTVAPEIARGRVIVAHLGNGASLCAMQDGKSVETTMGLTALDGLPMGTRCGALDAGAVLWMMARGMSRDDIEKTLYQESGLKGLSGISSDMRELLASDSERAKLAIEFFTYRIAQDIGKLAVTLGGLDGVVFTGGIGEHAAPVREAVCVRLKGLFGIDVDHDANAANKLRIDAHGSRVPVFAIPTDEEGMIALHTARILRDSHKG
ncbi:acetate/propionate family kinase [Paraburkholderia caballeronis]|uniref:acetate/propionate family kinase n=1 Tax=Paraburkholderia caballeronis TaxID=416943 RepID=UPI001065B4A6|nr:acetate/propionate family kinase [Paraburkholderia caballeronis]TDV18531.1 acetate kinase [Paraburkholderia caballeronis]TDV19931.1 acetate kinase [Paraburkholderia caballeronis]TDV28148.1 acetate kinase [Paraburkholderia caballeronis]